MRVHARAVPTRQVERNGEWAIFGTSGEFAGVAFEGQGAILGADLQVAIDAREGYWAVLRLSLHGRLLRSADHQVGRPALVRRRLSDREKPVLELEMELGEEALGVIARFGSFAERDGVGIRVSALDL